ncbi:sigma-Y antisigma factor component [Bacillus sp. S/N-304-OC-R1]|uniref:sigma-Y antisigma factor component n=1 Tax=Bacillus sp. S/N-304-OC-R1 TaxID=2758034 RepID=UPI001C8D8197|nr:sigma-Y antisigma factor component [Bacillus sp. S/N-304-OC-R1]MBY0123108.1 sigma-Y antisigma factor component [Bacillus sp. S/N-304-OC-R1]
MNEEISVPILVLVAVILISQSTFLFINARKHGHNYWLWGILGLIQAPSPTIFYLIFVRKIWKKKKTKH